MSNTKNRLLVEIPVAMEAQGNKRKVLKIELSFRSGGMNYATYANDPKGLYLSVKAVIVEDHENYSTELSSAFSGVKDFVKPMTRFSKKQLLEYSPTQEQLITLVTLVVEKNSLKLIGQDEKTSNESLINKAITQYLQSMKMAA